MITRAHALRVCPFPRADRHIETTRGVRHIGEKGEVRPAQGRARVRLDEQVVRPAATRPAPRLRAPVPMRVVWVGSLIPHPPGRMPGCGQCNDGSSHRNGLRYALGGRWPGTQPGPCNDELPAGPTNIVRGGKSHGQGEGERGGVGVRGKGIRRAGAPHRHRPHRGQLLAILLREGAGRALPLDQVPPAGTGRQHAMALGQSASPSMRPTRLRCSATWASVVPMSPVTLRARSSPSNWPSTVPTSFTRWPFWSRR